MRALPDHVEVTCCAWLFALLDDADASSGDGQGSAKEQDPDRDGEHRVPGLPEHSGSSAILMSGPLGS
jgi:hypothetical protein